MPSARSGIPSLPHSTTPTTHLPSPRGGLIMVELAIAILILTIGVLAVFTLFSTGLDTNARSIADTDAGLFADEVLSTLRIQSLEASRRTNWLGFWSDFRDGHTNIPVACAGTTHIWRAPDRVWASSTNGVETIWFVNWGSTTDIVDHVLRYKLDVSLQETISNPVPGTARAEVTLRVWNGEFGNTNDANAQIFYTEYTDPGVL